MDCLERIKELLAMRGWSMYQLSKKSKIPQSTLSNLFTRSNAPTVPTLEKICDAFEISLSEFFSVENESKDDEIVSLYNNLSPKSREALLEFLKTLK